jgi:hypothetical protein
MHRKGAMSTNPTTKTTTTRTVEPRLRTTSARAIVMDGDVNITVGWLPSEGFFADCRCRNKKACRHVASAVTALLGASREPRR